MQQKMNLWDEEKKRLSKMREDAENRLGRFVEVDPMGYPTVTLPERGVCAIKSPCCGSSAFHFQQILHQCAFCRKYYYVLGENFDG